jgi:hypothetical protein
VKIEIFDIAGKKVETLVNGMNAAGIYEATFDASKYSSGVYFYKLTAGDKQIAVRKMVLLK